MREAGSVRFAPRLSCLTAPSRSPHFREKQPMPRYALHVSGAAEVFTVDMKDGEPSFSDSDATLTFDLVRQNGRKLYVRARSIVAFVEATEPRTAEPPQMPRTRSSRP